MKKTSNGISYNLRNIVYERDSYTCVLCERPASECHHVVHRSLGGRDTPANLVAVCRLHHLVLHGMAGEPGDMSAARAKVREYVEASAEWG